MKKIEFFIARRISTKESGDRKNVMVRIATITVAVSMAVMLVAMAVISGFKGEITDKVIGFGAHAQIIHLDGNRSLETVPIKRSPTIEKVVRAMGEVKRMEMYAVKGGIIKGEDAMEGIMLKGVDGEYDWSFFEQNLIEGRLPTVGDSIRTKDVIISKSLARKMRLVAEDRVEMLFMQEDKPPRRDRFKVVGIYDTGFEELDKIVVLTDLRNVQRLNRWSDDQITGYEVTTNDFAQLDQFSDRLLEIVVDNEQPGDDAMMVVKITERFPSLFDWLKAHDVNVAVIVIIMLLVALLNMVSAMLIIVFERTQMIGVLKALGMSNWALQKTFIIRSAYIIIVGLFWGNVVGLGLSLIQKWTGVVKLNQAGYFLSEAPISLEWQWIVGLNVGAFLLIVVLLMIPIMIVSKIKPDKTVRYQ